MCFCLLMYLKNSIRPCLSHIVSTVCITLQLVLKVTGIKLQLITDPNIYLVIKSGIYTSLSYVAQYHTLANFPEVSDYWPDQLTSHLLCLDCNLLYTTCQTYSLLIGDFWFLNNGKLVNFTCLLWRTTRRPAMSSSAISIIHNICTHWTTHI